MGLSHPCLLVYWMCESPRTPSHHWVTPVSCSIHPLPFPARYTGLLAFLHLLGSWPWAAAPLLVDPGKEVGQEARRALHREFGARAAAGAAPAMFLATPRDLHASRW